MKFRCSLYCKIPANIETQFEKSSKTIDIFLSVSGYISCNASTLQSLAQLHGEWKLPVGFLFLSFRLASTVLSLCFHRFSNVSLIRGRVALRYAAGRFLEKERPSVVRSIKIYACATSLQQARTLFWRQSRKRSPPPRRSFPLSSLQLLEKDWLQACTYSPVRWPPRPGVSSRCRSASSSSSSSFSPPGRLSLNPWTVFSSSVLCLQAQCLTQRRISVGKLFASDFSSLLKLIIEGKMFMKLFINVYV